MHIEVQVGIKIDDIPHSFIRISLLSSSEQGDSYIGLAYSLFVQKVQIKWHMLTVLCDRKQTSPSLSSVVCYPQNLIRIVS